MSSDFVGVDFSKGRISWELILVKVEFCGV
jgi:hypothetical protein